MQGSGSLPFKAESMASLIFKITNEESPDVTTIRADITFKLSSILSKALTKDIEDRYKTGTEMARDLKTFLAGMD